MEKILFISPLTLDRKSLILTLIVCILPTLFQGWMFYRSLAGNNTFLIFFWGCMAALFLGISVAGFICTPYKYVLTNSELIIKRHFKDIVIPLQNIKLIRQMTDKDKKGLFRSFGAEGCFGSWGYYQTSTHKKLTVLTRRYNHWTLIVTDRKKYVIAPDDLQLIDVVAQQIEQTEADLQSMNVPAKQWRRWIPAAIVVAVIFSIYFPYKEPKFVPDINAFKLKGMYGVNIPFAEISKVDTIAWREMPDISIRANGISLFKVRRGKFRTIDGDKIHLNIHCGINPVIRIVDRDGAVYYINRKNATETRQIFNKIQKII